MKAETTASGEVGDPAPAWRFLAGSLCKAVHVNPGARIDAKDLLVEFAG